MNTDNTTPLFSAEQARKATIEGQANQLGKCLKDIQNAAANGNAETWYWTNNKLETNKPTDLVNEIKALGYETEAKYSNANDEWYFIIKW